MASLGHIAVGMAGGRALAGRRWRPMLACAALAMSPDLDVIAFTLGVPYSAPFGHRGAAHSIAAALAISLIAFAIARPQTNRVGVWAILFLIVLSHGLLDTLTDGGLGVALLWPFSNARFFAPFRPIPVAPIGAGMLSSRGLYVVLVEAVMFLPLLVAAMWPAKRSSAS